MPDSERALLRSRPVHRNPLSGVCTIHSSDEENSIFPCCAAVESPVDCCVLQMPPRPILVDLTGVPEAGNQAAGDEVHRWIVHLPLIVGEEAAPLPWISSRPKLNRLIIRKASYNQDPCKVLI